MSTPVERDSGVSVERERRWGWTGSVVGSLFGAGSAVVAVGIDGASFFESGPYPEIFERSEILAIDVYVLAALVTGAAFSTAAAIYARRSPFPRSDAFGAALMGGLLSTLAGAILAIRLYALVSGA